MNATACSDSYGGWVTANDGGTGSTFSFTRNIGWMTALGVTLFSLGTGGTLTLDRIMRGSEHAIRFPVDVTEVEQAPTPLDNLMHIREVLHPSISQLASSFGVSRQSVYNWLNGAVVAPENASRIHDLAEAADVLSSGGVPVSPTTLSRRFEKGRTLLEVVQAGGSARSAAELIVRIAARENAQRRRMNTQFSTRSRRQATEDFDLPQQNDSV
jgi:transcriptional regulator with XRE-family HTH domain